ncbi:hypothetical protein CEXT_398401 [Caerostris extrusa]|uniref:Uncharacterized protein n=1 Tax=Caerostris extrusa TaxID=172846 RepID=A0AAV4RR35_CAEEX|nr:hypothetical protein CEXT_398401 [Caerostris extrusa]
MQLCKVARVSSEVPLKGNFSRVNIKEVNISKVMHHKVVESLICYCCFPATAGGSRSCCIERYRRVKGFGYPLSDTWHF